MLSGRLSGVRQPSTLPIPCQSFTGALDGEKKSGMGRVGLGMGGRGVEKNIYRVTNLRSIIAKDFLHSVMRAV